ncbi:glycosyl hydrolase family 8 [Sediminicoccus sp. KRV36]|uniref:glycosyl hydrolase family 8 n=1 Tax=Sediminicoccus sp. KRV36 TaxID=3133721 RepID=UPI00200EA6B1|nr:glycosyl hydrolase family 8 [Sediminicoccus rosea]UPY38604.1 glycosyl hydrolase family 5 [Sediminicoccus rosea]
MFWCVLVLLAGLAPPLSAIASSTATPASEWTSFIRRYVLEDGRVIDTANGGISHSEGQGYGLFFAVHFNDRPRFEAIWNWTRENLARPGDGLHAWRYDPHREIPVADQNNATDGDIFIAWALLRAAERWQVPEYRAAAERIARGVLRCCVREFEGRQLLLPGTRGFTSREGVTINLSYYAFPALRALSRVAPDPRWALLERDALGILLWASYGRWRLPPDWMLIPVGGGRPSPALNWPGRFSWDALRIPLNLAWQHLDGPTLTAARLFWDSPSHAFHPPAWVDLRTGEIAPYRGHAGIQAVQALARLRAGEDGLPAVRVAQAPDYFGAALVLQTRIATTMPLEAPALTPPIPIPESPPDPGFIEQGRAFLARIFARPEREASASPPPSYSRPPFRNPSGIRGTSRVVFAQGAP